MTRPYDISRRLKKWGVEEFGALVSFARALGISQQSLHDYTSGRTMPGNKMQSRLRSLGCDIEWLMTGSPRNAMTRRTAIPNVMTVGWAKFEGRVVSSKEGEEELHDKDVAAGAGVPYRRGSFFCLEIVCDGLLNAVPLSIYPGDLCILEAGRLPKNGDIVAVRLKQRRTLVRVANHISAHEIEFSTANKFRSYPSVRVKKADIQQIGVLKSIVQLTDEEKKYFGIE